MITNVTAHLLDSLKFFISSKTFVVTRLENAILYFERSFLRVRRDEILFVVCINRANM